MKRNTPSTRAKTGVSDTSTNFSFGSGRSYGDAAEYATKGLAFDVLGIVREAGRGYEPGKDRWALTVKAADRDCEVLTLGCNPKRDEELRAAQAHLERGGTITKKRLHLSGGAYYFRDSE